MKIDKVKDTYSEYKLTISFGQLKEIYKALSVDHTGPIADEMWKALDYYMAKLPLPGEDKEDKDKAAEKAEHEELPEVPVNVDDIKSHEDLDKVAPNPPEE